MSLIALESSQTIFLQLSLHFTQSHLLFYTTESTWLWCTISNKRQTKCSSTIQTELLTNTQMGCFFMSNCILSLILYCKPIFFPFESYSSMYFYNNICKTMDSSILRDAAHPPNSPLTFQLELRTAYSLITHPTHIHSHLAHPLI